MRPLLRAAIESSVQPIAYHGMWGKLPTGWLGDEPSGSAAVASGIGVPHHGGPIAAPAVPAAVSGAASSASTSTRQRRIRGTAAPPPPSWLSEGALIEQRLCSRQGGAAIQATAGERTSAASRSATRSSADSIPTDSRIRFGGAANDDSAVEACVIRAGTSIRLSTPPRLSASLKTFVRATSATASSSDSARNETIPPKSLIWRAAISWPGWDGRPG